MEKEMEKLLFVVGAWAVVLIILAILMMKAGA